MQAFLDWILRMDPLEFAGLVSGLVCVWLLIRENVWTWPIGIVYVVISIGVFLEARLYADLALHVVYLVLNTYGWWYWTRGGRDRAAASVPVSTTAPRLLAAVVIVAMLAAGASGWAFARWTDADLPYWDNTTTMLSLAAMWLSTRKKLENWILWFVVDVLATGIYFYKGLDFYALLYLVYVGMAVAGYRAWRRSLVEPLPLAV
ncbi:MAG TPA: nicotinamide riboside transporter PnuC [Pseudomonadales bacterium]|nr:nicotinamide riboside transporter PnuC [Pseudomonadales bacterium]